MGSILLNDDQKIQGVECYLDVNDGEAETNLGFLEIYLLLRLSILVVVEDGPDREEEKYNLGSKSDEDGEVLGFLVIKPILLDLVIPEEGDLFLGKYQEVLVGSDEVG